MLVILASVYPSLQGLVLLGSEALLEGKSPKRCGAASPGSIYKEVVPPGGPQAAPAATPGWHLCYCLRKAGQASFAQSPNHGGDGNCGFSPGLKVSEPGAEVTKGLVGIPR